MTEIHIDPYATASQLVGKVPEVIMKHYEIPCSSYNVYMTPGFLKHLKKRNHWDIFMTYYQEIPSMIANPDYVGQNPKEPNSIELYKALGDFLLVPVKLNTSSYLYLSSFYGLDNGASKIEKRLRTGRIRPFSSLL
ncbi:hypothetical protein GCM10028778_22300 [Barrientosiimonas marina]|uniref:Plasmid-related protein n=1 Tax=Lentibacillus kimchii TaxID=1542911 RepID=A0ABW2UUY9_9BACI